MNDVVLDFVLKAGTAAGPVFAFMWYLEWKERHRIQRLLERYLPVFAANTRTNEKLVRVMSPNGDEDNG